MSLCKVGHLGRREKLVGSCFSSGQALEGTGVPAEAWLLEKCEGNPPPPWVTALPGVCVCVCVVASLGYNPERSGVNLALLRSSCSL